MNTFCVLVYRVCCCPECHDGALRSCWGHPVDGDRAVSHLEAGHHHPRPPPVCTIPKCTFTGAIWDGEDVFPCNHVLLNELLWPIFCDSPLQASNPVYKQSIPSYPMETVFQMHTKSCNGEVHWSTCSWNGGHGRTCPDYCITDNMDCFGFEHFVCLHCKPFCGCFLQIGTDHYVEKVVCWVAVEHKTGTGRTLMDWIRLFSETSMWHWRNGLLEFQSWVSIDLTLPPPYYDRFTVHCVELAK